MESIVIKTNYEVEVRYTHLEKPDIYFGTPGEHSVTVDLSSKLKAEVTKAKGKLGLKKINGIDLDKNTLKAKSKVHVDKGKFPKIYDKEVNVTRDAVEPGDKVRLNLIAKDAGNEGMTLWLNAIQLIEKGEGGSSSELPFTPVGEVKNGKSDELPF